MTAATRLARLNAISARREGMPGTHTAVETGDQTTVDVVIDNVTGVIATETGPIEARPVAEIPEAQLASPQQGDRLAVGSDAYNLDAPLERNNGVWRIPLIPQEDSW